MSNIPDTSLSTHTDSTNASCPECDAAVAIPSDAVESEILACSGCSVELEIVRLDPAALALAPEVAEDWGE